METLDFAGNAFNVRMRALADRRQTALDLVSAIRLAVVETALQAAEHSQNVDRMRRRRILLAH